MQKLFTFAASLAALTEAINLNTNDHLDALRDRAELPDPVDLAEIESNGFLEEVVVDDTQAARPHG